MFLPLNVANFSWVEDRYADGETQDYRDDREE